MKELFEKYGVIPIVRHQELSFDETTDTVNKHCVINDIVITPDKVLALEEVVYDMQQEDFYPYKPSKDKWCYQWKREYFAKDTRINALCSLLIYLHQYFNGQEREQIQTILKG